MRGRSCLLKCKDKKRTFVHGVERLNGVCMAISTFDIEEHGLSFTASDPLDVFSERSMFLCRISLITHGSCNLHALFWAAAQQVGYSEAGMTSHIACGHFRNPVVPNWPQSMTWKQSRKWLS